MVSMPKLGNSRERTGGIHSDSRKSIGQPAFMSDRRGPAMTDTIELLEIIGKDASLRSLPTECLSTVLDRMHASENLKRATVSGDNRYLYDELGHKETSAPQIQTQGGCEDDDEDTDTPDHDTDGAPPPSLPES
jgi:hypothetical protein